MVRINTFRNLALSFLETDEHLHFDKQAFRIRKKIFAILSEKDMTVNLKLSLLNQSVFVAFDSSIIYPVPGGWGRMGYTSVNLKKVSKEMLKDALTMAYCHVAPKRLAEKYFP